MNQRQPTHKRRRQGTATVEMAICLPVLLTLTIATIDVTSAMYLKESIAIAAYEGARAGSVRGGTDAEAIARVEDILDQRGITYDSNVVSITPVSFENAETLEHVQVTVSVPVNGNILSPADLFTSGYLTSFVWMRKEYENL